MVAVYSDIPWNALSPVYYTRLASNYFKDECFDYFLCILILIFLWHVFSLSSSQSSMYAFRMLSRNWRCEKHGDYHWNVQNYPYTLMFFRKSIMCCWRIWLYRVRIEQGRYIRNIQSIHLESNCLSKRVYYRMIENFQCYLNMGLFCNSIPGYIIQFTFSFDLVNDFSLSIVSS